MDKIKKGRLEWFFDFINMDLSTLSPGDVVKVSTEISLILHSESLDKFMGPLKKERTYKALHEWLLSEGKEILNLESCQQRLSDYLTNMFNVIDEASKPIYSADTKTGEISVDINTGEKKIFSEHGFYGRQILEFIDTQVRIEATFNLPSDLDTIGDRIINTIYKAGSHQDTLLIHFIQALNGTLIGAIRKCPECGNWFLHVSKRVKRFCSNKCAAKKVSRERRERIKREGIEAYNQELKNGAKRARKSYEKKVKRKIPMAKIERRPRKHKDDTF